MEWKPSRTEEQVRIAVADSQSYAATLRALGLRAAGGNFATLRRLIEHYGVSTDHSVPNWIVASQRHAA